MLFREAEHLQLSVRTDFSASEAEAEAAKWVEPLPDQECDNSSQ